MSQDTGVVWVAHVCVAAFPWLLFSYIYFLGPFYVLFFFLIKWTPLFQCLVFASWWAKTLTALFLTQQIFSFMTPCYSLTGSDGLRYLIQVWICGAVQQSGSGSNKVLLPVGLVQLNWSETLSYYYDYHTTFLHIICVVSLSKNLHICGSLPEKPRRGMNICFGTTR